MAKDKDTAAAKAETAQRNPALDLIEAIDPTIRRQVEGVLLGDPAITIDEAVRKVTQAIADGILSKPTPGDISAAAKRPEDLAPPKGTKVAVRRVTGGEFTYHGRAMDRGQVFELLHLDGSGARDAQLVRLGYLSVVPANRTFEICGTCSARFVDATTANAHHTKRHVPVVDAKPRMEARRHGETQQEYDAREAQFRASVIAQDAAEDEKGDRAENARAPLYMDQTKASRA
jgi:hypothetical protein